MTVVPWSEFVQTPTYQEVKRVLQNAGYHIHIPENADEEGYVVIVDGQEPSALDVEF